MSLEFPENETTASRYVRQAIPLMVKNNIPPNPCNFALWYAYVSNRDFDLKVELEDKLEKEGTFSKETTNTLFRKHVIKDEIEHSQNLQDSLGDVVKDLLGDVANTASGADAYCHDLEESLETLINDKDPEHIKDVVQKLITVTKDNSQVMNSFQDQLKSAELEINTLKLQLEQKEKDAYLDALTKIGNRRAFDQKIFELCESKQGKTTLVLVDLDHFKQLNDNYGHLLGDKVLQGVAEVLKKACPENTMPARYGGEEFAILVEDGIEAGYALAEKIRKLLKVLSLRNKSSDEVIDNITASFGVAELQSEEHPEELIERTDKALYFAKENGRDQVAKAA